MAGRTNFTNVSKLDYAFAPENAAAFCEGMAHRAGGTGITAPITDNPYATDPEIELNLAWNDGWNAADSSSGGTISSTIAQNCPLQGATVAV